MLGAGVAAAVAGASEPAAVDGELVAGTVVVLVEGATVEQAENTRTEITISDAIRRFDVTSESSSFETIRDASAGGPGMGSALHLLWMHERQATVESGRVSTTPWYGFLISVRDAKHGRFA